jgi:hypothetical protein
MNLNGTRAKACDVCLPSHQQTQLGAANAVLWGLGATVAQPVRAGRCVILIY